MFAFWLNPAVSTFNTECHLGSISVILHSLHVVLQARSGPGTSESLAKNKQKQCEKTGWLYKTFVFLAELTKLRLSFWSPLYVNLQAIILMHLFIFALDFSPFIVKGVVFTQWNVDNFTEALNPFMYDLSPNWISGRWHSWIKFYYFFFAASMRWFCSATGPFVIYEITTQDVGFCSWDSSKLYITRMNLSVPQRSEATHLQGE